MSCDPNFSSVVLLLPMGGGDGSTTFVDSSLVANVVTANNGAVQSNAQTIFGLASSGDFSSITSRSLTFPVTPNGPLDLTTGQQDFTVEFWYYPTTLAGGGGRFPIIDLSAGATTLFDLVYDPTDGTNQLALFYYGWAAGANNFGPIVAGQWQHIAIVRQGASLKSYIGGSLAFTQAISIDMPTVPSAATDYIGATPNHGSGPFNFYISEVRVTKGLARYTAAFTPPSTPFGGLCPPTQFGAFAFANAFAAIAAADLGNIKPRVWIPGSNTTIRSKS